MAFSASFDQLAAAFPFLQDVPLDVREALKAEGKRVRLEPGQFICFRSAWGR